MATTSAPSSSSSASPSISFFGHTPLSPSKSLATSTFLTGDESITIIPSFNLPTTMSLISGHVGPFRAGMDVTVPLWLAIMLRKRKLCKLIPPQWMQVEVLRSVLKFERDVKEQSFSPLLPFRHAEISRAILAACRAGSGSGSAASEAGAAGSSELQNSDQIRILLEDISTVRMDKIRRNVHQLSGATLKTRSKIENIIDVTNIGSMEMHAIAPFVLESFRMQRELSGKGSGYSLDVEGGASAAGGGGGGGGLAASGGRGRLRQSRLLRESEGGEQQQEQPTAEEQEEEGGQEEEEELMEPRPMDEMEGENDDDVGENDNAGRSRLRRHR